MIATDWNSLQIWWHAQLIPDTDQSSLNWGHGITEAIFSLSVWLWWKWIPQVEVYLSRKEVSFWPQATGWGHTPQRLWIWWKWTPLVEVDFSRKEVSFWPQATGWGHTQPLTEATQWLRPLLLTTSTKRPPIPKNMWKGPETEASEIFCFFPLNYCQSYLHCHRTSEALLQRFHTHILVSVKLSHPYFGSQVGS